MTSKDQDITKLLSLKISEEDGASLAEVIKRELTKIEEEIISYLLKKNNTIKFNPSDINGSLTCLKLTNNLEVVVKHESIRIKPDEDVEKTATICQSIAIGEILEDLATPYGITNTFNLNCSKSKEANKLLSLLIKGTSKISNTIGIPSLNTSVSINNPVPLISCAALGVKKNRKKVIKDSPKNSRIFFIGKLSDFELTKEKQKKISAYHIKFIKDALVEMINCDQIISVQYMGNYSMAASIANLIKQTGTGANINLSKLFRAIEIDKNYDCLLSDKPNSFLIITNKDGELIETARKWELDCFEIGESISDKNLKIRNQDELFVDLPIVEIRNDSSIKIEESYLKTKKRIKNQYINKIPLPKNLRDVAWFLLRHPNIASTKCIHSMYDSMVGSSNLNINFQSDANIIKVRNTDKAIAIYSADTVSSCIDPSTKIQIEIADIIRKLGCSGARINNFSINIKIPEAFNKKNEIINDLYLGTVTSSKKFKFPFEINYDILQDLNNTTPTECAYISLAASGIMDNCNHQMTMSFKDKGNVIFLIGQSKDSLATSEYLNSYLKKEVNELPDYNQELERKIQLTILELIKSKLISSAHNISKGGLFISLLESAMVFGVGFDIITDTDQRTDSFLFGEQPGRIIVSVTPNKEPRFIDYMINKEIPFLAIGHVTKGEMRIDDISYGFIDDAKKEYYSAFNKFLNKM